MRPEFSRGRRSDATRTADGTVPTALHLTDSVIHTNGLLQLTYETAGIPIYGEAADDTADLQRRAGGD